MTATTTVFLDTADTARDLLDHESLEANWSQPSPLSAMTMGDLAAHLCRAVVVVDTYLDTHGTGIPVDAPGYFMAIDGLVAPGPEDPTALAVRDRAARAAAGGLSSLRLDWDRARVSLAPRLASETGDRVIAVFGSTMTIDDYLVTRLVELVVHSDDLAFGLGRPPPQFSDQSVEFVLDCLWTIVGRRARPMDLIRSMTRVERQNPEVFRVF